ncbi:MAG: hypothetical protein LBQ09_04775 [Acidobacteriaceae bacterium]|jgi:hypothetical protein|nr:hypothetical protein [Acidobacteriaceae bacterium]
MSDRKYRQRGYQDDPRERPEAPRPKPPQERAPGRVLQDASGPRTPNLMSTHEVFRCARCGNLLSSPVGAADRCNRCGTGIHSCINCVSFDTSARWECSQHALTARVAPKDDTNLCTFFEARTTVERQTGTTRAPETTSSARQAFDDLFK